MPRESGAPAGFAGAGAGSRAARSPEPAPHWPKGSSANGCTSGVATFVIGAVLQHAVLSLGTPTVTPASMTVGQSAEPSGPEAGPISSEVPQTPRADAPGSDLASSSSVAQPERAEAQPPAAAESLSRSKRFRSVLLGNGRTSRQRCAIRARADLRGLPPARRHHSRHPCQDRLALRARPPPSMRHSMQRRRFRPSRSR